MAQNTPGPMIFSSSTKPNLFKSDLTSMAPPSIFLYATGLVLIGCVYLLLQVGKRDPRMPRGPPTIPILGNAHQIPATGLYKQ